MTREQQALTEDGITLHPSPQFERLVAAVRDLIITAYERSTKAPGKSLRLVRLDYVSAENNEERCSLLFRALVRGRGRLVSVPLQLEFIVGEGE